MNEILNAAKSPLEHLFDNYNFCGAWCKQKLQTSKEKQSAQQYYQCKKKDIKLYEKLLGLSQVFPTEK
eukprot:7564521-Ditylum_brightwellii.AAC.1